MEGQVMDDSFQLNQLTFSTFYEVKSWCEENMVVAYGTFWDLFSILVAMKPKYQMGKDMVDKWYLLVQTKSIPFENDLAASCDVTPKTLGLVWKAWQQVGLNKWWLWTFPLHLYVEHRM